MKRTDKIGVYLKLSCSALLLSGSLVGYGFTKDVFADSQSQSSNVENTSDSQTIAERVKQAKDDIKNLQALSDSDIKSFGERLDKAKDQSSIDDIIKDAKDKNNQLKDNQSKSSSSNDDNTKELDKLLDDLDLIAKNVDTHQQKSDNTSSTQSDNRDWNNAKENSTSNEKQDDSSSDNTTTSEDSGKTIVDKLDSVNKDLVDDKASYQSSDSDMNTSSSSTTQSKDDANQDTSTQSSSDTSDLNDNKDKSDDTQSVREHVASDLNQIRDTDEQETSDPKDDLGAISTSLKGSDKIDHALAKVQDAKNLNAENYVNNKLEDLKALDDKVNEDKKLSEDKKQELNQQLDKTKKSINRQHDTILNQLVDSNNKAQATEDILNRVYSKNEASDIMKHIKTKGHNDQDIANQIAKQLDGLSLTSGEDILKSMLDQSKDKEKLIKELLSTRLGNNKASKIAKNLLDKHLSNSQIVDELKHHFNTQGKATADDILNGIINDAKDKKKAIETILRTRINKDKARLLAGIIARVQTDKADIMDLINSALEGKANDLLQLEKRVKQAKKDINHILEPIKDRPSLLDRIHNGSSGLDSLLNEPSLLDKLNSGGSLLDKLGNSGIPLPEDNLSLGSDDGLLSGLFDDDGNISLPSTGEVIKQHWISLAIVMMSLGGVLIWLSRRKKHQGN